MAHEGKIKEQHRKERKGRVGVSVLSYAQEEKATKISTEAKQEASLFH